MITFKRMEQKCKDNILMPKNVNGMFLLKDTIVQISYINSHFQVYVDINNFIKDKYLQKRKSTNIRLYANSAKLFPWAS